MFTIRYKAYIFRIIFVLIILFSLSFVNAFETDNYTDNNDFVINSMDNVSSNNYNNLNSSNDSIYIFPNGDDDSGNGTIDNPYSTLARANMAASSGSDIYLMEGNYTGVLNTGLTIDKNLSISGLSNNVFIDGENLNGFFNINNNVNLTLSNLNFINGYGSVYGSSSAIVNNGNLLLYNCTFKKINNFLGTILNNGNLHVFNSQVSNAISSNYGGFISNIGNCSIINSKIESTVYNNKNISIENSSLISLTANNYYRENTITTFINNSTLISIAIANSTVTIKNSTFKDLINYYVSSSFKDSNVTLENTNFYYYYYGSLGISNTSLHAVSCIFQVGIHIYESFTNITYSAILSYFSLRNSQVHAPYNWWGTNKGYAQYSNYRPDNWIVMTFNCEEDPISVGTNSKFITSLDKFTDGVYLKKLNNTNLLPSRKIVFESQNGNFSPNNGYLVNGTFSNYLISNNESSIVYAIIDSQRMRLVIGAGISNYTWYLSNKGHDGFGDGSFDNPFKTLYHTISKALNGNTIYLFNGTYTNNWNANLNIVKDLKIIGLGNVTISRENDRNIFIIKEWGSLTIDNINFTVNLLQYSNPLFVLTGGNLTILNSDFNNIKTEGIITTSNGIHTNGLVNIYNSKFKNIIGIIVRGSANVNIDNTLFEKISNIYYYKGMEEYNCCIPISSSINITNSNFTKNTVGAINLHPYFYSVSGSLKSSLDKSKNQRYANVINCSFIENTFFFPNDYYASCGIGLNLIKSYDSDIYSFLNNCTFFNNYGPLVKSIYINNSNFFENKLASVYSKLINNSHFYKNSNLKKDYGGSYEGDGIASGDNILNSTFIANTAAYGGAISYTKEVHYCIFVNNTAKYKGNDIFSYSGDVDYSSNWWGSNQKPDDNKIYIFLGSLTLKNWIIMSLKNEGNNIVKAGLNCLLDDNRNISSLNYIIPSRDVYFTSDFGIIMPNKTKVSNNTAFGYISKNKTSKDFNVYATIDYQTLDLTIHNNSTQLIMENAVFYGKNNKYNFTLINVNGYKISNQTLTVYITDSKGNTTSFTIITNDKGYAEFKVDYPIGIYEIFVYYGGNGYFESCNNTKNINVLISITYMNSYNYTFYGKNNNFYAILTDVNGVGVVNQTIRFTIINSKGQSKVIYASTNYQGRSDIILNLYVGTYIIKCEYLGNSWYKNSNSQSKVVIRPVNSTIIVPNATFYGEGNVYNIMLKDSIGTFIKGETITVILSQGNQSDEFILKTSDYGVASLTINYLPGEYNVSASFIGDEVYGYASGKGKITVEKIYTKLSNYHHLVIPLNGYFTVILEDMYGRRITNENITLNLYEGSFLKSYKGVSDGNGEVNFKIDLDEGKYLATIDYYGNIWYLPSTSASTIIVSSNITLGQVRVNATDFVQYYGENKYFLISFFDPNAFSLYGKNIAVTLSSSTWSKSYNLVTDVFGFARLQINLNPGIYNISYKYVNSFYGLFASGLNIITVYKMPSFISASNTIINHGEAKYYEINLKNIHNTPIKNSKILIDVNGTKYNATTNIDGIARLLVNWSVGKYNIKYSFDNPNYLSSSGDSIILILDSNKVSTDLKGQDINGLDNETFNFTVLLTDSLEKPIISSEILLNVSTAHGEFIDTYRLSTDSNGKAIFKLNLEEGHYIFFGYYKGTNIYLASYSINHIYIEPSGNRSKTRLYSSNTQFKYGSNERYYVVLSDDKGKLLANETITFSFNNKNYTTVTDSNGKAYLNLTLNPGLYNIRATYNGSSEFIKASIYSLVAISGNVFNLFANDIVMYFKNGTKYYARLLDHNNKPLFNRTISLKIHGVTYNRTTDKDGWVKLNINLSPGVYEIIASYFPESSLENMFIKSYIKVLSTLEGKNLVKYYKNNLQFHVKVLDNKGKPIINSTVEMNIYGVFYKRKTDENGWASLNINLNPNNYILTATHPKDGLKTSYHITVLSTLEGKNLVKYYKNATQYEVKVLNAQGKALKNTNVKMNIHGVFYTRKTNSEGIATLNINLAPNNYIITVYHPETGLMFSNTITVLPTLEGKDLTMNYKDGSFYSVRLVNGLGKPISGETIKMNIYGVFYYRDTNDNGIAKLNINLMEGKYIITSTYKDSSYSNSIIVNKI